MRIVVDLPAPFGPKKPTISPFLTSKLTRSSARKDPKYLVRLFASIITSFAKAASRFARCASPPSAWPAPSSLEGNRTGRGASLPEGWIFERPLVGRPAS